MSTPSRWFSLIEILIVLSLVSVLLLALRYNIIAGLRNPQRDLDTCSNHVRNYIQGYISQGLAHKGDKINTGIYFPSTYFLLPNYENKTFVQVRDNYTYENWTPSNNSQCNQKTIQLQGNIEQISIQSNRILINSGDLITGDVELYYCIKSNCQLSHTIVVDSRNAKLYTNDYPISDSDTIQWCPDC